MTLGSCHGKNIEISNTKPYMPDVKPYMPDVWSVVVRSDECSKSKVSSRNEEEIQLRRRKKIYYKIYAVKTLTFS